MRILHVLAPAPFGGLEQVVEDLTSGLARRGHEVHVAAVLEPGAEWRGAPSVPVHRVAASGRGYAAEVTAVDAVRRRLQPDVVHTHGYRADVLHGVRATLAGCRTATTAHGFTGGDLRNRCYESMQRVAFRGFGAVAAVSAPLAHRLRHAVRSSRLRVIPNAWCGPPPLPRDVARRRLGVPHGRLHIGWVGRLSPEKGGDLLLDALARVRGGPWAATVIGDGAQGAVLRGRAARLGIAERVRFAGVIPGAAALYAGFDVFVLSSRTEGTPIVLFEAAAAGVPVVATRVGGVPQVVREGEALLVPPGDPTALAAAIDRVAADPGAAAARAEAARRRIETDYGPGPWLDAYEALYDSLTRGAR